jgi:hypothetical protein
MRTRRHCSLLRQGCRPVRPLALRGAEKPADEAVTASASAAPDLEPTEKDPARCSVESANRQRAALGRRLSTATSSDPRFCAPGSPVVPPNFNSNSLCCMGSPGRNSGSVAAAGAGKADVSMRV